MIPAGGDVTEAASPPWLSGDEGKKHAADDSLPLIEWHISVTLDLCRKLINACTGVSGERCKKVRFGSYPKLVLGVGDSCCRHLPQVLNAPDITPSAALGGGDTIEKALQLHPRALPQVYLLTLTLPDSSLGLRQGYSPLSG